MCEAIKLIIVCNISFIIAIIIFRSISWKCEHYAEDGKRIIEYSNPEKQYLPSCTYFVEFIVYLIIVALIVYIYI